MNTGPPKQPTLHAPRQGSAAEIGELLETQDTLPPALGRETVQWLSGNKFRRFSSTFKVVIGEPYPKLDPSLNPAQYEWIIEFQVKPKNTAGRLEGALLGVLDRGVKHRLEGSTGEWIFRRILAADQPLPPFMIGANALVNVVLNPQENPPFEPFQAVYFSGVEIIGMVEYEPNAHIVAKGAREGAVGALRQA